MFKAKQIANCLLDGENLKTFLGRHPKEQFRTGDSVYVTPVHDDIFDQEFMGTVVGKRGIYFQVSDQDGNAFDCLPGQLKRIREDRENIKQFLTRNSVKRKNIQDVLTKFGFKRSPALKTQRYLKWVQLPGTRPLLIKVQFYRTHDVTVIRMEISTYRNVFFQPSRKRSIAVLKRSEALFAEKLENFVQLNFDSFEKLDQAFINLFDTVNHLKEDRENIKQFLTRHKVRREGLEKQLKNLGFLELLDKGSFLKKIKMTPYDYALIFITPSEDESGIILHYELHKDHETTAHDRVDVSFEHGVTPKLFVSFLQNFIAHAEKAKDIAPTFNNFRIGLHLAFSNLENALFRATHRP